MVKPRINVEIDEKLKHKVQIKASKQKTTLTKIVSDLLKVWLRKG